MAQIITHKWNTDDWIKLPARKKYLVKYSKKYGRGLYAAGRIEKGTELLVNHLIIAPNDGTHSEVFSFEIPWNKKVSGIALGEITLVNHAEYPNCDWECFRSQKNFPKIKLYTISTILPGEQLFINYGYNPEKK